jgi:hypothetical protein
MLQPLGVNPDIVIDKGQDFTASLTNPAVERIGLALAGLKKIAALTWESPHKLLDNVASLILRIIVDDQ